MRRDFDSSTLALLYRRVDAVVAQYYWHATGTASAQYQHSIITVPSRHHLTRLRPSAVQILRCGAFTRWRGRGKRARRKGNVRTHPSQTPLHQLHVSTLPRCTNYIFQHCLVALLPVPFLCCVGKGTHEVHETPFLPRPSCLMLFQTRLAPLGLCLCPCPCPMSVARSTMTPTDWTSTRMSRSSSSRHFQAEIH